VPSNTVVKVRFNDAMDVTTFSATSVHLLEGPTNQQVAATLSLDASGRVLTIAPAAALSTGIHHLTVDTTVADLGGNHLSQGSFSSAFTSTFTVGAPADTTAPTVVGTSPANGASGVPLNALVVVHFSETIAGPSVAPAALTVSGPHGAVSGTVDVS